jgi:hypothetical protein
MGVFLFAFAVAASAQTIGAPGITYNGGKSEKDVCQRDEAKVTQKCAGFFQRLKDGLTTFSELRMFNAQCVSLHRAIAASSASTAKKIADCQGNSSKAAELFASVTGGASDEAIAGAKSMATELAQKLRACTADLQRNADALNALQLKIDQRVEAVRVSTGKLVERMRETDGACNVDDVQASAQAMGDIFARYGKGLTAVRGDATDQVEGAQGPFERAAEQLEGFAKTGKVRAGSMNSLILPHKE